MRNPLAGAIRTILDHSRAFVPALAAVAALPALAADAPPAGRYRCYQPPSYTVTAWFDFEANGSYRINGGNWQPYRYDAAKSSIRWAGDDFDRRLGIYIPPSRPGAEEIRYTIVLARRADAQPGTAGWERLERCYLTTH